MPPMRPPDWTPPPGVILALWAVLLVGLNVFDAFATVEIVRRGGEEANPLVRPLLERGFAAFLAWKAFVSGACATALALVARAHRMAWWLLVSACAAYALLGFLHAYLLLFVARPS